MSDAVKVAVRVRPFNNREKKIGSKLIVRMENNSTYLSDPKETKKEPRKFTFDHSYWSHDGSETTENGYLRPMTSHYTDQDRVFADLGTGMLANAWAGYNCSIFAYGQTGSGKSYTIMGTAANKGIVPMTCEKLFDEIKEKPKDGIQYEVMFNMMEIYNEQVRDLLNKQKTPPGGLKVKEAASRGFYVEGLTLVPVGSYNDIHLRITEGNRQRTIASTNMNETSSRAHTIVTVQFCQNSIRTKTSKLSSIKLVDLAGSERAKQTGATGERFEESKNINKSLLTLGNVIKGLCDKSKGKSTIPVPYRDSVLTKLLKSTLGGNSKTVMIAAISPDGDNYDQTLSTLKYADRAKSIRTQAQVNETSTDKLIQELIAEKERLLSELRLTKAKPLAGYTDEDIQRLKEEQEKEISSYREQMIDAERAWEKRLADARQQMQEYESELQKREEDVLTSPHLSNLNQDPELTGKIIHILPQGKTYFGNGKASDTPDIVLHGPRITSRHAFVENLNGQVQLSPEDGAVLHNGSELAKGTKLRHQDRIRFGSNNLFVFLNPKEKAHLKKKGVIEQDITYSFAMDEIVKHSGLGIEDDDSLLREEVVSLIQTVQDACAMAEELHKPVTFSLTLVSPEARGSDTGRTQVYVKVTDTDNDRVFLWERNEFLSRQVLMQDYYRRVEDGQMDGETDKHQDPFWEPEDTAVIFGVARAPLSYLGHMLEFQDEPISIIDYFTQHNGFLKIELIPCDDQGNEDVDLCVEDPIDLVGRAIAFKIKILQSIHIPDRFVKTWCKYRFYKDKAPMQTEQVVGPNPMYGYERLVKLSKSYVTHKLVDYLRDGWLVVEVWGQYEAPKCQSPTGSSMSSSKDLHRSHQKLKKEIEQWKNHSEILYQSLVKIKAVVEKSEDSSPEMKEISEILNELFEAEPGNEIG